VTPPRSTPLIDLAAVALDTESTGLDVRADRIVQIGAVRLRGAAVHDDETFEALLDPGVPIPAVATRIHGLAAAEVAGKPGFAEVAPALADFLGRDAVIGHAIAFDLALLRFEAARHGIAWSEPAALDVGLVAAGLDPALVDTSLDALARALGLDLADRHSALGDARLTAAVWAAMLDRLREAGVRTLGEAEALARRPAELIARHERAGWHDRPGKEPGEEPAAGTLFAGAATASGARKAIDGFLYRTRLAEVMGSPPITIAADATLHEAARVMHEAGIGCLIVPATDRGEGILTERDLLRALAADGAGAAARRVAEAASAPVITAPETMLLYRALGRMARRNLRYLGVRDAAGALVGVFTLRSLLRERALGTLAVGDEIATAQGPAGLARAQAALPGLAGALLADGLDARDIAAVIAAEGHAMAARAAEVAEAELEAAGAGPPPAPYALLVLGSAGRGESLLAPDQDNALLIADGYQGDLDDPEDWFARLGARVCAILDSAGVPFCEGGVMARNRPWRRRASEWREQIAAWADHPTPESMLNVDIFYDFAPAHLRGEGAAALVEALRRDAAETARGARSMLRAMGEMAGERGTPLGFFGRVRTDDAGRADLKAGGLLPIVAGARVIALRHGVVAGATPTRLREAAAKAGRGGEDAALLADIHGFLMRLILAQQIRDIDEGLRPGNRVAVGALERADAERLRAALGRVGLMRDVVRDLLEGL
jgi:signal-transduction protein with cAMP-binding, CBS, and nucleotidyltransferase domain/DNA polymerase III epsilon subunit-like protein